MRRLRAIKGKKKGRPVKTVRSCKKPALSRKSEAKIKKVVRKESPDQATERNFREHQYWMLKRREYWRKQFMNLRLR